MVTPPLESGGRLFRDIHPFTYYFDMFPIEPLSSAADSYVFETYGSPFAAPLGANGKLNGDSWESRRGPAGWEVVRHVTPTGAEMPVPTPGGISADHRFDFVFARRFIQNFDPNGSLAAEGDADYIGDQNGKFEMTGIGSFGVERLAQGRYISPGGTHVIFSTGRSIGGSGWCHEYDALPKRTCPVAQLEPEAAPAGTGAIYDREVNGPTHVVSLLPPNELAVAGQEAIYQGAATDASSIAFKVGSTLYVRVNNGEEDAKTELVASSPSTFGGISSDGTYLYYATGANVQHPRGGDIHRFDTVTETDEVADPTGDADMVNVSADGTRLYFISPSQLDGAKGAAGEPNLYVWSGGSAEFIATVDPAETDPEGKSGLTAWTASVAPTNGEVGSIGPGVDPSRTTPDGSVLVFESKAQLTPPYDNAGKDEIYRYDDSDRALVCVSCNPAGTPATVDAKLERVGGLSLETTTVIHNLTTDGGRVFFETAEPLLEADDDGQNDIYEWQAAGPEGLPVLNLISSGHSVIYPELSQFTVESSPNLLMAISPDGSDVTFRSFDSLTPGASVGGAMAVYDARVGGGFAQPVAPTPCLEEGCRPPAGQPPTLAGPATAALQGSGNLTPRKKKSKKHRRCHRHRTAKTKPCPKRGRQARASASTSPSGADSDVSSPAASAAPGATPDLYGAAGQTQLSSSEPEFGIASLSAELSTTQAARHPDFAVNLSFGPIESELSPSPENVTVDLPPGFYANPDLIPTCKTGELLGGSCPIDSQVGVARILLYGRPAAATVPLFNLAPPHPEQAIARLGFMALTFPVFIDPSVRTAGDYGVTTTTRGVNGAEPLVATGVTVWGNPAAPIHDEQRMTIQESIECNTSDEAAGTACKAPGGKRSTEELGPIAFTTNPSACEQGEIRLSATAYRYPGELFSKSALIDPGPISDCQGLPFDPSLEARPTSDVAGAPTGLETKLSIPQSSNPSLQSTATMREAKVTLPAGMAINPSAADGLQACSDQQVHFHEEVDAQCPDAAKLGSLAITSPALPEPLQGTVYQRSPEPGRLFGLWLVVDQLGLHVKIPGEVRPDPQTGQLTAVFSDLPQVPVSEIDLAIWGGARAPLVNPNACGTYQTTSQLYPHSQDPPATPSDSFRIDRSSSGGTCPTDPAGEPNSPAFEAGTATPISATYSPFLLRLRREDGSQQFGDLQLTLPPGLVGKLAGLSECSDAALTVAAAQNATAEQATPSCPAQSLIGSVRAAAGAGPAPYWVSGSAYLAGPYQGAPVSVAIITPALAGPFDLGTVVVRSGLQLDPTSAQITIKAALPRIIAGVPLNLRTVAVEADRPGFTLNGTSCDPLAFSGTLTSTLGAPVPLSERFQLTECSRLRFKPKLSLTFKGPTTRRANPALIADLRARPGDVNIARAKVKLPGSAFLDNSHIGTVCTRVQFAADRCPKRSIYGKAQASTPLLDYRVQGSVYLRSSDHLLPDLVVKLKGPVSQPLEFDLVGRIDSVHGALRTSFESTPDVPIDRFHLKLFGGKRGLIVLSDGICKRPQATIGFTAQNGRVYDTRPAVKTGCSKHGKHRR